MLYKAIHFQHSSGTKNVAKATKPIAYGPVKKAGLTWFPELADKS